MTTRYAAATEVSVAKSRAAIEELLKAHGATEFASGWDPTHDKLQFRLHNQVVRFLLPRPDPADKRFTFDSYRHLTRSLESQRKLVDQADRQRWRALYLVIRAKIEAVEAGIAIFEQEFLAFIVQPNGLTIGDILVPRLQAGESAGLLTDGGVQ